MRSWLAGIVVLVVVAGCGGKSLQESDPNGWQACLALITMQQSSKAGERIGGMLEAAKFAAVAESDDIKAASDRLVAASTVVDTSKLTEACEDHGVKIPKAVAVDPNS